MFLFKLCIGVVSPFIYVFAQYYGATVLSNYCSLHYLFLDTKFPILLAAFWAVSNTVTPSQNLCHSVTMKWFVPDGRHHHLPSWWLIVYYHQTSGFCWWKYFLHIHSYIAEMWRSLQRLTSACPNWCHSVTPSFLAIYPKRTTLCFVFWCLKKGLREKC